MDIEGSGGGGLDIDGRGIEGRVAMLASGFGSSGVGVGCESFRIAMAC